MKNRSSNNLNHIWGGLHQIDHDKFTDERNETLKKFADYNKNLSIDKELCDNEIKKLNNDVEKKNIEVMKHNQLIEQIENMKKQKNLQNQLIIENMHQKEDVDKKLIKDYETYNEKNNLKKLISENEDFINKMKQKESNNMKLYREYLEKQSKFNNLKRFEKEMIENGLITK